MVADHQSGRHQGGIRQSSTFCWVAARRQQELVSKQKRPPIGGLCFRAVRPNYLVHLVLTEATRSRTKHGCNMPK
jgi:hypothetical protein